MDDDFKLIRKMKQGDEHASDTFVRKYYTDILRYCSFHSESRALAEDLTQETFVRFFTHLGDYHHLGKAKNYLYTIAHNLCANAWARAKPLSLDGEALSALELAQTPNAEDAQATHLLLEWALAKLSPEEREVIILYYYQGLKQREIAEVAGIGLPLVKYRLKEAKRRLATLLGKEDFS